MKNPIDILGVDPSGAFIKPADDRDHSFHSPEIGMASAPFDWSKGYDVQEDLGIILPTKDQGRSSSCGGQTISQSAETIGKAFLGEDAERSAKAYYSQAFVPNGGSNSRVLANLLIKQGLFREALVSSYENGRPPSEAFMERPQDISAEAMADAKKSSGLFSYSFPVINIDIFAQALRDCKGMLIGIMGSNNGTWLSSHPSPTRVGTPWAHFMFGAKAKLENGVKTIWAKQSWGTDVAPETSSFQAITEDHFAVHNVWDGLVFHYAPTPPPIQHTFNSNLVYGMQNNEVYILQTVLARDGVFNLAPTGKYFDQTARAVLKFRAKHGIDTSTDPRGHTVGFRTRAVLNTL